MKKIFLLLALFLTTLLGFSQGADSIIMNDSLTKTYFKEYVEMGELWGFDIQQELLEKIDYIIIVPKNVEVNNLAETDLSRKLIILSSEVKIDRDILKVTLFRELSYVLGVPYNQGSVIMDRVRVEYFRFGFIDDYDIKEIEMFQIFNYLKKIKK